MSCFPSRRGLTPVEVLIVLVIVAALIGLLLPAVVKVRSARTRMESLNRLRQQSLCCHNFHDAQMKFPTFGGDMSVHVQTLPYVEASRNYAMVSGNSAAGAGITVMIYVDPLDPTAAGGTAGRTGFAWNPLVFVEGSAPRNLSEVKDGASNTVMLAQKFSQCGATNAWYAPGTAAALEGVSPALFLAPAGAAFETTANAPQLGAGAEDCVPGLAASALHDGILVSLMDASARPFGGTLATSRWHSLCTPDAGEVPPACW